MRKDMTIGNPMKIILLFSLPVLLGNLFQQFYNMVDTVIVGQYLGGMHWPPLVLRAFVFHIVRLPYNGQNIRPALYSVHRFPVRNHQPEQSHPYVQPRRALIFAFSSKVVPSSTISTLMPASFMDTICTSQSAIISRISRILSLFPVAKIISVNLISLLKCFIDCVINTLSCLFLITCTVQQIQFLIICHKSYLNQCHRHLTCADNIDTVSF